jgi:predicted dehydrogenase
MSFDSISRRDVLKVSAGLAASSLLSPIALGRSAHVTGQDVIRVGVIGCGGRGTGAAVNALEAHASTRIVALADLMPDRIESSLAQFNTDEIADRFGDRAKVARDRCFSGFDAYQKLLELKDIDMVILATSPGFRPMHFEAAVAAGKHVFMEKPVAVDPVGIRKVIAAGELAASKGLSVVSGTQRRHEDNYLAAMEQLASGAIGEITSARCYWNQGGLWVHTRKPEYTDMEWQCRNWLYFTWLSGDHLVEQHVHNIDVINWAMGGPPVRCTGLGGRQSRTGDEYGHIFDHFAIEYEYANGASLTSMCRQIEGTPGRVEEVVVGTKGTLRTSSGRSQITGANAWKAAEGTTNPYVQEHVHLIQSIRGEGPKLNEARRIAESTLTAIMGRMACYTGQPVSFDFALKESKLDLSPASYAFGPLPPTPVAIPGKTKLI